MHSQMNYKEVHSNVMDRTTIQQLPVVTAFHSSSPFTRFQRGSTPNLLSPGQLHQFKHSIQPTRLDWVTVPSSPSIAVAHKNLDMRYQYLMKNTDHNSAYELCEFHDKVKPLCKSDPPSPLRGFGNEIAALTQTLNHLKLVEDRQSKQFMVMSKLGMFDQQRKLLATDFDDYNLILMLLESIDDKRIKLLEMMNRLEIVDTEQNKLLEIVKELKSVGDRLKEGILIITNGGCSTAFP